ncbi:heme-binding protein [Roseibacillus persicicus]|uniref:heme-binding protein n=1 Tax=Roseibacillus persicicus TaxID=454148 RepID=UPI00398B2750
MKSPLISLVSLGLLVATGCAEQKPAPAPAEAAAYVDEASLPKGWPVPGPYNEVTKKEYPAYRAAFTAGGGQTRSFWTLFMHIKKQDIPMTAPVEMKMEEENGELEMTTMGFLYQDTTVGEVGADGEKVEVTDVPAMTVYSYAWMGPNNSENVAVAKEALTQELAAQKVTAEGFRLLGYNGPSVPKAKRTHELQAILKK